MVVTLSLGQMYDSKCVGHVGGVEVFSENRVC
jgi:hypothetical protein